MHGVKLSLDGGGYLVEVSDAETGSSTTLGADDAEAALREALWWLGYSVTYAVDDYKEDA